MLLVAVIVSLGVSRYSTDPSDSPSGVGTAVAQAATVSPYASSLRCRSAHRAIRFYVRRYTVNVSRIRAAAHIPKPAADGSCPVYLAHLWQRKAYAMRVFVSEWLAYQFNWREWLPDNWRRLGACETGYGREPGSWSWDSGRYVSAFGIYRAGYADDAHRIGQLSWDETIQKLKRLPTPREQYLAALSHLRTYGDGWGCPGP